MVYDAENHGIGTPYILSFNRNHKAGYFIHNLYTLYLIYFHIVKKIPNCKQNRKC